MSMPAVLWIRLFRKWIRGRIPRYAAVVTTSTFYRDEVFRAAFRSRHVLTTGYPRNGFDQFKNRYADLVHRNVDAKVWAEIEKWKSIGRKIVLIAPTFRDTRASPLGLDQQRQLQHDARSETDSAGKKGGCTCKSR